VRFAVFATWSSGLLIRRREGRPGHDRGGCVGWVRCGCTGQVTYDGVTDMTLIPLSPVSGCGCETGTASYFAVVEAPDATGNFPDGTLMGMLFDVAVVSGKIQVTYTLPPSCVTTYTVSSGTVMGVGDPVLAASTVNLAARPAAAAWALLAVAATLMALLA
jgi:hypothetical protein